MVNEHYNYGKSMRTLHMHIYCSKLLAGESFAFITHEWDKDVLCVRALNSIDSVLLSLCCLLGMKEEKRGPRSIPSHSLFVCRVSLQQNAKLHTQHFCSDYFWGSNLLFTAATVISNHQRAGTSPTVSSLFLCCHVLPVRHKNETLK